jgi:hypothetical protein
LRKRGGWSVRCRRWWISAFAGCLGVLVRTFWRVVMGVRSELEVMCFWSLMLTIHTLLELQAAMGRGQDAAKSFVTCAPLK